MTEQTAQRILEQIERNNALLEKFLSCQISTGGNSPASVPVEITRSSRKPKMTKEEVRETALSLIKSHHPEILKYLRCN